MPRQRCWASAALVVALVAAGCTPKVTTGADLLEQPSQEPTITPSATSSRSRRPSPPPAPTTGVLRIVVQDEDDFEQRSQIPISYRGPRSGRLTSDAEGVAAARLPQGDYRIDVIAGCHKRVEVFSGSGGNAGVVAGSDPTAARLTVKARRRYWGGTPIQHDMSPPWPRGQVVTLRYRLYDRCKDLEAPRTSITDVRYRPSENIELVGAAGRAADGASDVTLHVRCTGRGTGSLTMYDPENPDDATDLLSLRPASFDPEETWCG